MPLKLSIELCLQLPSICAHGLENPENDYIMVLKLTPYILRKIAYFMQMHQLKVILAIEGQVREYCKKLLHLRRRDVHVQVHARIDGTFECYDRDGKFETSFLKLNNFAYLPKFPVSRRSTSEKRIPKISSLNRNSRTPFL